MAQNLNHNGFKKVENKFICNCHWSTIELIENQPKNISIKYGDSKIETNTKNKQFQFSWVDDDNNRNFRNPTLETKQPK